ncbi:hypothetical protein PRIPAC_76285, partial [Pristionchus pacificus]|uniref:Uncharacterized protein n=1 Tax=Pristionchus pacificus TaxID=54126 RepID=A0A2A6C7U7_PRIPA
TTLNSSDSSYNEAPAASPCANFHSESRLQTKCGGSGGHGTRGTSGGSRNPGSIKGTGSKPGSGSKPGYGWNVGGPTGGPKPGNKYVPPPPGYSGSGSYKKGNVYNWNYNYPPVYVYASAPRIRNPLEYPGNYHGGAGSFRAGTGYVTVHNYNYYASKRHLPKNSAVKCSRKTKGIPPGEQNTTSPVETEMAWACPSDSVCCEWECCVKPQNENKKSQSSSDGSRWVLIFFLVLIIGVAVVSCVWWMYCCYRESTQEKHAEQKNDDAESTASTVYSPPPVYNLPPVYPPAPDYGGAYPAGPAYPPAPATAYPGYPPAPVNPG